MQKLDIQELKKMMLLSYERVERRKEEINKINVFPVPDQDTGNNLTKTLAGIKEAIEKKSFQNTEDFSESVLNGALTTAQGNAGVIYTGFLAGFLPQLSNPVDAEKIAQAFWKGLERAKTSIQDPKEGTILDVIEAAAIVFEEGKEKNKELIPLFQKATEEAGEALLATQEKMEIFKKANVVDAGGLGFLIILESFLQALKGEKEVEIKKEEKASEKVRRFVQVISHRYEVVSLTVDPKFDEKTIRQKLQGLGNCLDIVQVKNRLKIHIHTDYPEEVKEVIRNIGDIQSLRVEDMSNEVVGEESVRVVSVGLITDGTAPLLPKIKERYQIEQIPLVNFASQEKGFSQKEIFQKMREARKDNLKELPSFSLPQPQDYLVSFQSQLKNFQKILCITPSSKIFDCYKSAWKAKNMLPDPKKVFVLDSSTLGPGQSLLVLRAVELIQEKRELSDIVERLKKTIPHLCVYIAVRDPKWLGITENPFKPYFSWIRKRKKIRFQPLMEVKRGELIREGTIFAPDVQKALFKKVVAATKKERGKGKKIRIIIAHGDDQDASQKLKKDLKNKISLDLPFIDLIPPIMGSAVGPGSLVVGWMPL